MSLVFLVVQTTIRVKPALGGESFYPDSAVSYLSQNMPDGEIFSTYGWGGYLVWKLPEKKVYINGWMPLWSRDNAPEGESKNAFRDYLDLTSGDLEYRSEFEKYNIDTVLWTQTRDRTRLERFVEDLLETLSIKDKSGYSLIKELEADGWVRVYQDNVAVIYQRM